MLIKDILVHLTPEAASRPALLCSFCVSRHAQAQPISASAP